MVVAWLTQDPGSSEHKPNPVGRFVQPRKYEEVLCDSLSEADDEPNNLSITSFYESPKMLRLQYLKCSG